MDEKTLVTWLREAAADEPPAALVHEVASWPAPGTARWSADGGCVEE
ncbi:hypothetical protein [Streptomyces sp. NPDC050485]